MSFNDIYKLNLELATKDAPHVWSIDVINNLNQYNKEMKSFIK